MGKISRNPPDSMNKNNNTKYINTKFTLSVFSEDMMMFNEFEKILALIVINKKLQQ